MDPAELDALKQIRIERRLKQIDFQRELDALLPSKKPIIDVIESDDYKEETAHFWIDSVPQRARIWINGVDVGDLTPAKKAGYYLEPGTYKFELALKNHLLWSETVTLAAEEEWSDTITLEKRANLKINSTPERARIWLDGIRLSDLTPSKTKGYFLDPGEHVVKLEKKRYPTHIETLDLTEGEEWNETITLIPDTWIKLKPLLEDHTISEMWWNLTESDRRSIAELAIKNTLFYMLRQGRSGKPNCEGGEGNFNSLVCLQNAIIRSMKFGTELTGADNCYYRRNELSEEFCYLGTHYDLPCYMVTCSTYGGGFGHSLAAIQVNEDTDLLSSWIIFQYSDFDIKLGHWQLPVDRFPGRIYIKIAIQTDVRCAGYNSTDELARWEF